MTELPYLRRLEAESIYIFRKAASGFRKSALLFSAGKDSADRHGSIIGRDAVSSFERMQQDGCF